MSADAITALVASLAKTPSRLANVERQLEDVAHRLEALRAALPPRRLVTIVEAAATLGISIPTARRWVRVGRLPSLRIGRTVRVDLSRFVVADAGDVAQLANTSRCRATDNARIRTAPNGKPGAR